MDDVQLFPNADKVIHFIMYFSLTFIFMIENKYNATIESQRKISILPITGFILFGILIELLQSFITSYRSTDFTDGLSNVLGILAAVIIYKITYKKIHKILKRL
jgi:VanZ family protein